MKDDFSNDFRDCILVVLCVVIAWAIVGIVLFPSPPEFEPPYLLRFFMQ